MNFEAYHFLIPRLWPDVVEILLVAFVIYRFLLFLVGTRAMQIVVGVMILSVAYFAALLAKFQMISFLLSVVFTYGAFAVVVVFQPELRNALARLGQSRFMRRFSQSERQSVAEEIAEAMDRLSRAGTGAIIAVEGDIGLEEFISSGVPMEAKVSADLLTTIFTPYSPLHDGAVLVPTSRWVRAIARRSVSRRRRTPPSSSCRRRPPRFRSRVTACCTAICRPSRCVTSCPVRSPTSKVASASSR
ncbi:MAG: hypothetical protein AUH07_06695 [Gemmatimonadetes bacterium 13_2_20CM_70_9]|nr:MAG: hypothetical protein AUH07_06695 [Gemmatimonadetes bacterium 13_2_20CM_70_9]